MTLKSRVANIEASLTPKQAVLEWLEEAREFASFAAYLTSLANASLFEAPRVRMAKRVEESTLRISKANGANKEAAARAVLEAQKQSDFLVRLVLCVNERLLSESERNVPSVELLVEQRARMAEQFDKHRVFESEGWEWWRKILLLNLVRMLRLQAVIAAICTKYYDGHRISFGEKQAELDGCIEKTELLAAVYNSRKESFPSWEAIDLASLRRDVKSQVPRAMRELVDLARAQMHAAFGEPEVAHRLVQAHVLSSEDWRPSDPSADWD